MMHMTLFPNESYVSSIVIAHLPASPPARSLLVCYPQPSSILLLYVFFSYIYR